jgi:hypothetical protein
MTTSLQDRVKMSEAFLDSHRVSRYSQRSNWLSNQKVRLRRLTSINLKSLCEPSPTIPNWKEVLWITYRSLRRLWTVKSIRFCSANGLPRETLVRCIG